MRTNAVLAFLILAGTTLPLHAQENRLALVGGMLLDGYDNVPPVHNAAILIEGDRIVEVGPAAEVRIPSGVTVIDTSGMTMLPGLIDLHAHLMILGHGDYDVWFPEYVPRLKEILPISARQLLLAGVTTAVDLGAPLEPILEVRDRINRGEIPGPRMLVSGPWVTRSLGRWQDDFQILIDTPAEAAAATRRLCEAGVDVIKAYVQLTPQHYRAIVQTAHEFGVQVHAHVYHPRDVRNALEAGVDVLQHVGSAGVPPYDDQLIRDIEVAGRPVVPTAAHRVWLFPDTVAFPERLQDQRLRADFPPQIYRQVQESFEDFHTLSYFATTDRQMIYGEPHMRKWLDSGAVIGIGTDSGTPMNFHTEAMWREMKVFTDLGMSPQSVITAATRINARILGRGRDLGTIEVGKLADILVVQGNPLLSITVLDRVAHVIKGGVPYRRTDRPEAPRPSRVRRSGNLAFLSTRDGNFEVYLRAEGGTELVNLTRNPASDYGFTWSPDGESIAFGTDRDGNREIYVMGADGSQPVNLSRHPSADHQAAWSPDGRSFAFVSDRDHPRGEIYVMDADGSNVRRLTFNELYEETPAWSPDGKRIAFSRLLDDDNAELFVMDADGENQVRLTDKPGFDSAPAWSPDGTRIAFHGPRGDTFDIFVIGAHGERLVNLTQEDTENWQPSWSPEGTRIAYAAGTRPHAYDIWIMDADGSNRRRITTHADRDESPAFRPVRY